MLLLLHLNYYNKTEEQDYLKSKRFEIFKVLIKKCEYSVGTSSVKEIEKLNILQSSLLAMNRALEKINIKDHLQLNEDDVVTVKMSDDKKRTLVPVKVKNKRIFEYRF